MDDEQAAAVPDEPHLPAALEAVRDALVQLRSEDLRGLDAAGLLADVAGLHTMRGQVEGEWLRRVGEVHIRAVADTVGASSTRVPRRLQRP